ncbi:HelD family protein [Cellulomonas sp. NS3]|uniref:HelD family protein n=1 Tax=Cellulomonas sp. NS3 TaxID=2973977 RepID=UPI00216323E5|nr:AAA family ATPase [Cellulomonas sp. NS3]
MNPPGTDAQAALVDELEDERRYLADARAALGRMRDRAEALLEVGAGTVGDAYAAERLGVALVRRVRELTVDEDTPLFFGRLDLAEPSGDAADDSTRFYIGRRHVTDDVSHPLVLDWRAPVSRAFYRASAREPQGVVTRRRFGSSGGALTSLEDEHLDRAAASASSDGAAGDRSGAPSSILTAEIERPRVGPMRDIVATIQPEQDELVRADLSVSLCVQGGPGTGKTAVGLHRAAFLFYTHRQRLQHAGVLIVGPNRTLIRYIAQVLPSLGELDAEQVSVGDLYPLDVGATDAPEVAVLKHDVRLAAVLHRALWSRVAPATAPVTVPHGSYRYTLSPSALDELVTEARAQATTYGGGRERLRSRIAAALRRTVENRSAEAPSESWFRSTSRSRPVTQALDAVWPATTPEALVHALLSDGAALAAAADGILDDAEQELLLWAKPARTPRAVRWSEHDAVLLDEVAGLLDRPRGYSHLIVDEAQDLSPMQCRALARRSTHGSVTVLGDLAQGTTPWAARSWHDTLTHLDKAGAEVVPLTTGFRVPRVVMEYANALVPSLGTGLPVTSSLRHDGSLRVRQVGDLVAGAAEECRAALDFEGSVGLIVPDSLVQHAARALDTAGLAWDRTDAEVPTGRIALVPASVAKGLEYDHVVAVEPARVVAEEARGLHRLYVVLTRAVSRLVVVHLEPLPEALRSRDAA